MIYETILKNGSDILTNEDWNNTQYNIQSGINFQDGIRNGSYTYIYSGTSIVSGIGIFETGSEYYSYEYSGTSIVSGVYEFNGFITQVSYVYDASGLITNTNYSTSGGV